jgi:hypothetical protein
MKRKYTMVTWHASAFIICAAITATAWWFDFDKTALMVAMWGLGHIVEAVYTAMHYRYMPKFQHYVPVHIGYYGCGVLAVKITSLMHFEFYCLFDGEVRVWCLHTNKRFTVFHPNWL